jgi:hypothetical protein
LQPIEESAFAENGVKTIEIRPPVEVVCKSCFYDCTSLTLATIESSAKLQRIEESVFAGSRLTGLLLPTSIHFWSGSAFMNLSLDSISF